MVSCSDHMMDCGTVSQDGMFRLSPPHFGHNGYVTADLSCSPATAAQIHELQPWSGLNFCCIMAVSVGSATSGENIVWILPRRLHQPGETTVTAAVSARRAAVLRYVCCYSCRASQKRMNTSAVPAALASSFILPARSLPTLGSADSADGVSSKTAGTVNRMRSSSSTKAQIPSALLLQHPTGCCPPKHSRNRLTSNISAFQPLPWG